MTVQQFIELVSRTRHAQQEYYRFKSPKHLRIVISLESRLDAVLKEFPKVVSQAELSTQINLFK